MDGSYGNMVHNVDGYLGPPTHGVWLRVGMVMEGPAPRRSNAVLYKEEKTEESVQGLSAPLSSKNTMVMITRYALDATDDPHIFRSEYGTFAAVPSL